ncbi:hypothetical protein V6N13_034331 [Hibiscus sabdariffa]
MSTKLEPKSENCTFVGYPKETKGYYFYNENKVFVARTGVFLEKEFLSNKEKCRNIELKEVQQQQVHEPEVEETPQIVEENSTDLETQPLRRSTGERHEPERYGFLVTTHGDVILVDQDEPKTYQDAVLITMQNYYNFSPFYLSYYLFQAHFMCAITRIEKEEMPQHSRKDDEQRDAPALVH